MSDHVQEQRQYARVQKFLPVEYFLNDQRGPIQLYTMDISAGGMRVKNPFPIEERFQFPMSVRVDSKTEIKVMAKVVWQKKILNEEFYETGLEFVNMSEEDRKSLSDFIDKLNP